MKMLLVLTASWLVPFYSADKEPLVFQGEWKNSVAHTAGSLVVIATEKEDHWDAKFMGEFQGDRFEYEITMKPAKSKKENDDEVRLRGIAKVDGSTYTWTGTMTEETFFGRYNSSTAKGDFRLSRHRGLKSP